MKEELVADHFVSSQGMESSRKGPVTDKIKMEAVKIFREEGRISLPATEHKVIEMEQELSKPAQRR